LAQTSAQASVEFTSPTTSTQDGRCASSYRLETPHHLRRLHRVRCRTHLEVDVRMRQAQVHEQAIVHVPVVVLPGMHEQRRHAGWWALKARRIGAIFMKLGRAPTTQITGPRSAGHASLTKTTSLHCFARTASTSCCSSDNSAALLRSRRNHAALDADQRCSA
jgi:hypothetical protein